MFLYLQVILKADFVHRRNGLWVVSSTRALEAALQSSQRWKTAQPLLPPLLVAPSACKEGFDYECGRVYKFKIRFYAVLTSITALRMSRRALALAVIFSVLSKQVITRHILILAVNVLAV